MFRTPGFCAWPPYRDNNNNSIPGDPPSRNKVHFERCIYLPYYKEKLICESIGKIPIAYEALKTYNRNGTELK